MSAWFRRVSQNNNLIVDCIEFFESELEKSKYETSLGNKKSIEKHASELPGIVEYRYGQLQEIEAILEYLNIKLRNLRSHTFKKYLEAYNRTLSSRDAEKYVDGDQDVLDLTMIVNEFALLRNKYLALHKGLDYKNWMIGHVTKLRIAGLEDATID